MEKKKMKLSLKKETIEVLNQNEMSSLYGGDPIVRPDISVRDKTCKNCESGMCVALSQYKPALCLIPIDPITRNDCVIEISDPCITSRNIACKISEDVCLE